MNTERVPSFETVNDSELSNSSHGDDAGGISLYPQDLVTLVRDSPAGSKGASGGRGAMDTPLLGDGARVPRYVGEQDMFGQREELVITATSDEKQWGGGGEGGINGAGAGSHKSSKGVSRVALTLNLITGGLGSGLLTLPWGMAGASIVSSVVITILVLVINGFTIMVLVRAAERWQRFDLGSLMGLLPGRIGKPLQMFTNVLLWCSLWMSLVSYIIVVQDSMTSVMHEGSALHSRRTWGLVGSGMVLPLCFVNQEWLSVTSSLSVLVNLYLFCIMLDELGSHGIDDGVCFVASPITPGAVSNVSLMMYTVVIQMCVLPMYKEMQGRSPERFKPVLLISFGFLTVLFSAFSAVGYMIYGPDVKDNILNELPNNGVGDAARIGMSVVVICVYPIMLMPMVAPIENAWPASPLPREASLMRRAISGLHLKVIILAIVASAMFCTFYVESLGNLNSINGAITELCFVACVPVLVGLFLGDPVGRRRKSWKALMGFIMVGTITMAIIGIFLKDNYDEELPSHCWARIKDSTADVG